MQKLPSFENTAAHTSGQEKESSPGPSRRRLLGGGALAVAGLVLSFSLFANPGAALPVTTRSEPVRHVVLVHGALLDGSPRAGAPEFQPLHCLANTLNSPTS